MRMIHFVETHRRRVAVLCGGDSHEREISLQSGRAVASALRERGHEVVCLDTALTPPEASQFRDVDVAFLALHGKNGEDGEIQSTLDRMNVLYTGSGAEASRLAFSKSAAKERLFQRGVSDAPLRSGSRVRRTAADARAGAADWFSAGRQTRRARLEPRREHRQIGRRTPRRFAEMLSIRRLRPVGTGHTRHGMDASACSTTNRCR